MRRGLHAAILLLGLITACGRSAEDVAHEAASSSGAGPGAGGTGGAAGSGATGGGGSGGDELPPAEVTRCPAPDEQDLGTNTIIRVRSGDPIDPATVAPSSLRVLVNQSELPGTIDVTGTDLTFVPEAPLPASQPVQVILSPEVRDIHGRSLAESSGSWGFTTAGGPALVPGFAFSPPLSPPLGGHAPRTALAMDGELAVLVWMNAQAGSLLGTRTDGVSFLQPVALVSGFFADQLALAVAGGWAHLGYTYFDGPGTILYSRADAAMSAPATAPLGISPASYASHIAAGPSGEVAMAWSDHPDYWSPWGARMATSPDSGSTFSPLTLIEVGASCPDLLYVGGQLVVAWTNGNYGDQELRVAVSDDNGATFSPPTVIASSTTQIRCPQLVDNHLGEALVLWSDYDANDLQSTSVRSYRPATGELGTVVQLTPPDDVYSCSSLAASAGGKVVHVRSRGQVFEDNWVTELFTSEDGGQTFAAPTPVDVLAPDTRCPLAGYTPSGAVILAWTRDPYELVVSRGEPRRPCQ